MDDVAPLFQQTLGPMGRDVAPAGDASFSELVSAYSTRLRPGEGPVHVNCMTTMAECRAAILAAPGGEIAFRCGFLGLVTRTESPSHGWTCWRPYLSVREWDALLLA